MPRAKSSLPARLRSKQEQEQVTGFNTADVHKTRGMLRPE